MKVPLLDLKAQYATIKNDILAAISDVLESQRCIGGPKVAELEKRNREVFLRQRKRKRRISLPGGPSQRL